MTTSQPDYTTMSKEELISLLQQRDTQIQQLKSGYLYIVQFENDKQSNIYKMEKASFDTFETRNYRSKEGNELGELHILRCAHARDVLEAEQFMHKCARELCQTAPRSDKRKDKCEWYINEDKCYQNKRNSSKWRIFFSLSESY